MGGSQQDGGEARRGRKEGEIPIYTCYDKTNLKIDFSIEHLFSKNDPNVEKYFSFREEFGREDNVLTLIYKPTDILDKKLYQELESLIFDIEEINGVNNIISIFSISDIDDKAWLGKIDGNNTNWNRDAYSNWITESQVSGAHHTGIYCKTSWSTGIIRSLILETWDFAN